MNKKCVKLTYPSHIRDAAEQQMIKRGIKIPDAFEGPDFLDVEKLSINDRWVKIYLKDGTIYTYPSYHVDRIKEYTVKE